MTRADGGATPPADGDIVRAHWPHGGVQEVIVVRAAPVNGQLLVRNMIIGGGFGPPRYLDADRVEQLVPLPPCRDPEHRSPGMCLLYGCRPDGTLSR